jgi:hypothetical protein
MGNSIKRAVNSVNNFVRQSAAQLAAIARLNADIATQRNIQ